MSTTLEENKAVVRRFFEVLDSQNLSKADTVLTQNAVNHAAGIGEVRGLEGWKAVAKGFFTAFPDLHTTVELLVAEDDLVGAYYYFEGTHQGDLMGIPPTGKKIRVTGAALYRIEDGKIAEEWHEQDNLGMMQQVAPAPAAS